MAYSTNLKSRKMINLAGVALGKLLATAVVAVDNANAYNLQMTGTPAAYLPTGIIDAAITASAEIDLSDPAVCAEAGMSIPTAGTDVAIFVLTDGTNTLARVGSQSKVTSRATPTSALVETIDYLTLPEDVDNGLYIVAGYVKFTTITDPFVVGTTSITSQTETYYQTTNMLAGTKLAAV